MSDNTSLLERYGARNPIGAGEGGPSALREGEDAENCGCFGLIRGIRERAVCLELRKKSGGILAIPYAYISRMELLPCGLITLMFGSESVQIKGRNLNREIRPNVRLFQGITRHRVTWVQEADRPAILAADATAVIVEMIE